MIGYVRRSFFGPVPRFERWEALNAQVEELCRKRLADQLRGHDETIGERLSQTGRPCFRLLLRLTTPVRCVPPG